MQEVDNVLRILKETESYIKSNNFSHIRELSDQTIHSASVYQDSDNILVAVIIYSISKLVEREKYRSYPGWDRFLNKLIARLSESVKSLGKGDVDSCIKFLVSIRESISTLSSNKLRKEISDVFRKAEINKASRIYEHGISMEKTSRLLGISLWELAEYAGSKSLGEIKYSKTINEKTRLKFAMEIFE